MISNSVLTTGFLRASTIDQNVEKNKAEILAPERN